MSMPLSKTNPFIADPEERDKLITRSVITSSRVEGIKISPRKLKLSGKGTFKIPEKTVKFKPSK